MAKKVLARMGIDPECLRRLTSAGRGKALKALRTLAAAKARWLLAPLSLSLSPLAPRARPPRPAHRGGPPGEQRADAHGSRRHGPQAGAAARGDRGRARGASAPLRARSLVAAVLDGRLATPAPPHHRLRPRRRPQPRLSHGGFWGEKRARVPFRGTPNSFSPHMLPTVIYPTTPMGG